MHNNKSACFGEGCDDPKFLELIESPFQYVYKNIKDAITNPSLNTVGGNINIYKMDKVGKKVYFKNLSI